jgi:hypothetical protein
MTKSQGLLIACGMILIWVVLFFVVAGVASYLLGD